MRVTVQHSGTEIPTCEGNKFAHAHCAVKPGQTRHGSAILYCIVLTEALTRTIIKSKGRFQVEEK
jgi:hypothetical protein